MVNTLLLIEEADNLPLHHIVIRPNTRIILENRLGSEITLETTGSYFLIRGKDGGRALSREAPISGSITISNREYITIVGAVGANVEIWIPEQWRSRLLR
jgi:hypothetical protein